MGFRFPSSYLDLIPYSMLLINVSMWDSGLDRLVYLSIYKVFKRVHWFESGSKEPVLRTRSE